MLHLSQHMMQELNKLLEIVANGVPEERSNATTKLIDHEKSGRISSESLIALSKEGNTAQVMYAIGALGRSKTDAGETRLIEMLEVAMDENPLYAETIIDALGECGGKKSCEALLAVLGLKMGWTGKLKSAISQRSKNQADSPLVNFLKLAVIKALNNIADPRTPGLVSGYLFDEDPLIRWYAIQLIMRCECREYKKDLEVLVASDDSEMVQEMASIAIEKLHDLPSSMNN